MHTLSEPEIDSIASSNSSVHLTFFGVCAGASIAFAIVLTTASVTGQLHATYAALLYVSILLSLYFGIRGIRDYREAKRKLKEIKRGQ